MGDRYEVILADPPVAGGGWREDQARRRQALRSDANGRYSCACTARPRAGGGRCVPVSMGNRCLPARRLACDVRLGLRLQTHLRLVQGFVRSGLLRPRPARDMPVRCAWASSALAAGEGNWGTDIPSVLHAPKRRHSQKPDAFYEIVESFGDSFCELFARSRRVRWHSVGKELGVTL